MEKARLLFNKQDLTVAHILEQHSDLRALVLAPGELDRLFAEAGADPSIWYLVDPAGWIMMSYNKDVTYKDVITDLKFLLKNSGG